MVVSHEKAFWAIDEALAYANGEDDGAIGKRHIPSKSSTHQGKGGRRLLRMNEVLIVAPYNAQVSELSNRIPNARVGTVDKFQGQQVPVVIDPSPWKPKLQRRSPSLHEIDPPP